MKRVIGLSGVAGSGKDTLFTLLQQNNPHIKRFALADILKEEINPFLKEQYGIDIFSCSRDDKNLIRPILVAHGKIRRTVTSGTYWTNKLIQPINEYLSADEKNIAIITDVRYAEYQEDELFWLKKIMNGHLIHITMTLGKSMKLLPPNKEEEINDPILRRACDYRVIWPQIEPFSLKNLHLNKHAEEVQKFISS